MRILTVPRDTVMLRTKSEPITTIDAKLLSFLKDLGETLKNQRDPQGVGLSAIQVGRPIRAFATFLPSVLKGPTLPQGRTLSELRFYINPEIIDHSKDLTLGEDLVTENRKQKTENNERSASGRQPEAGGWRPDNQAPGIRLFELTESEDSSESERPEGFSEPEWPEDSVPSTVKSSGLNSPRGAKHLKPFLEGCLSIPDVYGPVPRWSWIKARAIILGESDLSSARLTPHASRPSVMSSGLRLRGRSDLRRSNDFTLEKLASRVFQHELDHLNGILFTDRTLESGLPLYEAREKELVPMEM